VYQGLITAMSDIKAIILRGDFTEAEFGEIVALLRRLDDQRPDGHFEVVAVDPTASGLEHAERVMHDALPPQEGRKTDWATFKWNIPKDS
jgi:hypothetical protein